jgi:hypothetical protein
MLKESKNRKVVRVDELTTPKMIANEDFSSLCATFRIPLSYQQDVKARLDQLVTEFAGWMTREKQQPDRRSDHDRLKVALKQIDGAVITIERLGPSGRLALKAIAPLVAPMLAAQWISESFPDDDYAPRRSPVPSEGPRQPLRAPIRSSGYFIEEVSLEARLQFVSHRAAKTAVAALKEIATGFAKARQALEHLPGARGGRKPLIYRDYLIFNLIEMWSDMTRQISTAPKSDFVAFCEVVAVTIGWPVEGIGAAVPKVVSVWGNQTRKKPR